MSATELIQQIKALPREEQRQIAAFLDTLEMENETGSSVRFIDPETARQVSGEIFAENAELFRKLAL